MNELESAALTALRDCLGLRPAETLLILTDPPMAELAQVLARVARPLAREVLVTEYAERELNGQEPPPPVPALMGAVDVVLAVTSRSITHTVARRAATNSGTRVATMPGVTRECLIRTMNADYRAIAERSQRVAEMLTRARLAHVASEHGTDLVLPIDGMVATASTGLILHRGQWGNLPSGEAYVRPQEGRCEGTIVVDGSLAGLGTLSDPVRITVRDGVAVGVEGGSQAQRFAAQLERVGPLARSVAKLGLGTNDRAEITGNILEDEKALGTVHIAFGNNASLGGSVEVPFHVTGIIQHPTLRLDGQVIIDRGAPLF